jgi:circadian clock protein KaiB
MSYLLKLYITGQTPNAIRALENLKKICEDELDEEYEIKVIDILKEPQLAEDDRIIATPTLVKTLPAPLSKIIGDLSDKEKCLIGLDIIPRKREVIK